MRSVHDILSVTGDQQDVGNVAFAMEGNKATGKAGNLTSVSFPAFLTSCESDAAVVPSRNVANTIYKMN
jgi:hypothetical protein